MTVLLFGATGFLGSTVARLLPTPDTVAFVRPTSDRRVLPPGMAVRVGSLDDPPSVLRALEGIDLAIYCASMGFGQVPGVVEALERAGVKRALFISTTAIFTMLPAPTKAIRVAAEEAVERSSVAWTILRPTMIYGTIRDRNISRLLRFLHRSPVYPMFGDGRALHQPVYVEDVARAVVDALASEKTVNRFYNLAGAAPLTYEELVQTAAAAIGRHPLLVHVPVDAAIMAAQVLGRLGRRQIISAEQILRLAEDKAFDYAEAARDFGYRPLSFDEGVRREVVSLGLANPTRSAA